MWALPEYPDAEQRARAECARLNELAAGGELPAAGQ